LLSGLTLTTHLTARSATKQGKPGLADYIGEA